MMGKINSGNDFLGHFLINLSLLFKHIFFFQIIFSTAATFINSKEVILVRSYF